METKEIPLIWQSSNLDIIDISKILETFIEHHII